jgi:hypothetical protein
LISPIKICKAALLHKGAFDIDVEKCTMSLWFFVLFNNKLLQSVGSREQASIFGAGG